MCILTYCASGSLVKTVGEAVHVATLRCKRWKCDYCKPFRARALKYLCREGGPTKFLTLTVNPATEPDPHKAARLLVWAWQCVVKRIKRRYGFDRVPYIVVIERTKKGFPHLHVLGRFGYVPHEWLSEQMRQLINAPIVDVRQVKNAKQAAAYVAKYVGKDPHQFVGCKRYWRSQDWILNREKWEADRDDFRAGWMKNPASPLTIADDLLRRGFALVWRDPDYLIAEPGG